MKRRAKPSAPEEDDKGIKEVRGGSICSPGDRAAHLIRGSHSAAVCRTTAGLDPRPRWRTAGG
jgi:hypothetical protein